MATQIDKEELYDSLEEDFSSASSTSVVSVKPILETETSLELNNDLVKRNTWTNSNSNFRMIKEQARKSSGESLEDEFELNCSIGFNTEYYENCDVSSIVPLYEGDRNKSEVETFNKCSTSCLLNQGNFKKLMKRSSTLKSDGVLLKKSSNKICRERSIFTTHKNLPRSYNSGIETIVQDRHTKSYLDMFNARFLKKKELEDTVRSIFGDSQRSLISEATTENSAFEDANDCDSDNASCYFSQGEEKNKNDSSLYPNKVSTPSVICSLPSSKFNSVSELLTSPTRGETLGKRKPRSRKSNLVPVPVLGGLGPDTTATQEKLVRRKKQLNYGQKASNRNRIKMMEMHALKSLKSEIQKSNSK